MDVKKITLLYIALGIIFSTKVNAQFTDFLNYPLTVEPHESADSTRGHFWGYMFGSYYTKVHVDSGKAGNTQYSQLPQGSNAFSMQRVYLGYDYFFNNQFSGHIVIAHEENQDASFGSITSNYNYSPIFYLKYANIEWKDIFRGSTLSTGLITTPSFAITEEPFWGYRSIDRTIMDMKGITNSNDFGVKLGGKLWRKKDDDGIENACIGYNIMVGNGLGSTPDNFGIPTSYTVWKKYYGDIYVKLLNDKLVLDFFMDGRTLQWQNDSGVAQHAYNITERIFLGYKTKNFNISAEYFVQTEYNQFYTPSIALAPSLGAASDDIVVPVGGDTMHNIVQSGYSIMAAAVLLRDKNTKAPKLSLIARYDFFNPCVGFNPLSFYQATTIDGQPQTFTNVPYIKESYGVLGFDYQPIKQIHFMPNIWYDGITILNDPNLNLTAREKFDYDMVLRITFYYQLFKN
jgi:hypothetical protein